MNRIFSEYIGFDAAVKHISNGVQQDVLSSELIQLVVEKRLAVYVSIDELSSAEADTEYDFLSNGGLLGHFANGENEGLAFLTTGRHQVLDPVFGEKSTWQDEANPKLRITYDTTPNNTGSLLEGVIKFVFAEENIYGKEVLQWRAGAYVQDTMQSPVYFYLAPYFKNTDIQGFISLHAPQGGAFPKKVSRQVLQEDLILETIQTLGYHSKKLPLNKRGRNGVKSEVRKILNKEEVFTAKTSFDKAWERLSKDEAIQTIEK